jgi:hypothetical protein
MTKFIVKHIIVKMKLENNVYYSVKSIQTKTLPFIKYGSVCQVKNFNANLYSYDKVLSILREIDSNSEIYEQHGHHKNRTYTKITNNLEPIWEH